MKELIDSFNNENGNITYSTKELLRGLHKKVDNNNECVVQKLDAMNKRLENGRVVMARLMTKQRMHKRLIIAIFSSLAGLLGLILKLTKAI